MAQLEYLEWTQKSLAVALGSRAASTALRHFPSGYTSFPGNVLQGSGYSATGFRTQNVDLLHNSGLPAYASAPGRKGAAALCSRNSSYCITRL